MGLYRKHGVKYGTLKTIAGM